MQKTGHGDNREKEALYYRSFIVCYIVKRFMRNFSFVR